MVLNIAEKEIHQLLIHSKWKFLKTLAIIVSGARWRRRSISFTVWLECGAWWTRITCFPTTSAVTAKFSIGTVLTHSSGRKRLKRRKGWEPWKRWNYWEPWKQWKCLETSRLAVWFEWIWLRSIWWWGSVWLVIFWFLLIWLGPGLFEFKISKWIPLWFSINFVEWN